MQSHWVWDNFPSREGEMAQDFGSGGDGADGQAYGFQSWMIPRRTAIATACVRSLAPSFSMMRLM